jgi:hypothetical protein
MVAGAELSRQCGTDVRIYGHWIQRMYGAEDGNPKHDQGETGEV